MSKFVFQHPSAAAVATRLSRFGFSKATVAASLESMPAGFVLSNKLLVALVEPRAGGGYFLTLTERAARAAALAGGAA